MTIKNQKSKNKILGGGEPNLRSKFGAKEFYFYSFGFLLAACLLLLTTPILAQVQLETGLPGAPSQLPAGTELPSYIRYLFIFGLSIISILALAQMIIGGIMYILAAGNAAKVEDAKDTIFQALFGFGILLISYLLLRTINPDLVNLRNPNLTPIQFQFQDAPTGAPTGPNELPQSGRPSVLLYSVTSPGACTNIGGRVFSPCQSYCLATPGLCSANNVCCGKEP